MADEYVLVARGKLKLKNSKKSSKKQKEKFERGAQEELGSVKSTKAEISFKKMAEKMQQKRMAKAASLTHNQRVAKFNQKLSSLPDHCDLPKVSWTK